MVLGFSGIVCHMNLHASSCIILHSDIEKRCFCRPGHKELESRPAGRPQQLIREEKN